MDMKNRTDQKICTRLYQSHRHRLTLKVCIAAYVMQNGQRPKAKGKVTYVLEAFDVCNQFFLVVGGGF